jgi:hypothetical protein
MLLPASLRSVLLILLLSLEFTNSCPGHDHDHDDGDDHGESEDPSADRRDELWDKWNQQVHASLNFLLPTDDESKLLIIK